MKSATLSLETTGDEIVRTQITLTKTIKSVIEQKSAMLGISMSEYLRRAALVTALVDSEKEQDRTKLASAVLGSVNLQNHPEWKNKTSLKRWIRSLRNEWEK